MFSEKIQSPSEIVLMGDRSDRKFAHLVPDVEFARIGERSLKMQILARGYYGNDVPKHPLIVFVQGSAWTNPNPFTKIPELARFAREGYVVASVVHRSSAEAPFPACLKDVKRAIRYLRAHHEEYGIDPERVCIWGTSSGGNLALLCAVTAGMEEFTEGDYPEERDDVCAVVDFFGPTDLVEMGKMLGFTEDNPPPEGVVLDLIGGAEGDYMQRFREVSPTFYLNRKESLPPHLIVHGDRDEVVPYSQSRLYHDLLLEKGVSSTLARVLGGGHENCFWTDEVLDCVANFLRAHV